MDPAGHGIIFVPGEIGPERVPRMSPTPDITLADLQQTVADLRSQLAASNAERDEALPQQAASAEVLQVINSSWPHLRGPSVGCQPSSLWSAPPPARWCNPIEEGTGANPSYSCCTFRGSVVALEASTGKV